MNADSTSPVTGRVTAATFSTPIAGIVVDGATNAASLVTPITTAVAESGKPDARGAKI